MREKERIARHLCRKNHDPYGTGQCDGCDRVKGCQNWEDWVEDIDLCLFYIREPNERQVEIARKALVNVTFGANGRLKSRDLSMMAREAWRAIIDDMREIV